MVLARSLLFIVLGICGLLTTLSGQSSIEQARNKYRRQYERALDASRSERFEDARNLLLELIAADENLIEPYLLLGSIQYEMDDLDRAEQTFQEALKRAPDFDPEVWYRLGVTQFKMGKYETAAETFSSYLKHSPATHRRRQAGEGYLERSRFAAEAVANPVAFQPKPLRGAVNTTAPEYLPALTADGQAMIFTRIVRGQEDIYLSQRGPDGWSAGTPLPNINTLDNEGAHFISPDGRYLFFTACNRRDGMGSCDIYFSRREEEGWSPPRNLGSPVNTPSWESQPVLSETGRTLLFSSSRKGGVGGRDIWLTRLQANGRWSEPENLGEPVNTTKDEQAPFLHPDGKTLYFMSNGHLGMGGFDLFLSRLDSAGRWSAPQNLGYPINTIANEGALFVSLDGRRAFFASDMLDRSDDLRSGNTDLYAFDLPAALRPAATTYVAGTVTDAQTGAPLSATVEIVPLKEVAINPIVVRSGVSGDFLVPLPLGKDYAFTASEDGYLFFSEHFDLGTVSSAVDPIRLSISLEPIPEKEKTGPEPSDPVVLRNVFFDTGSDELRPESEQELKRLYRMLADNPELRIQVNGHTDNVGQPKDNQQLSEARAKAVYEFLVDRGIDAERLQYRGYGEEKPIASNETPNGRQQNRRTEFVILP